ncbi:MAG: DNA adenine methylase [Bacillota bacterium]|nr:DNA adenine methylase [Bacillota bacterium]
MKPKPPVKWAGGKGQLLFQFEPLFPERFRVYHEPFMGGGAVFFHLLPEKAVLIDNNPELINFYLVVRDNLNELVTKCTGGISAGDDNFIADTAPWESIALAQRRF